MKSSFSFFLLCTFVFLVLESGSVTAQRFTSNPQIMQAKATEDSRDQNARQALIALKAGKLDDARKYLAEADSSNPFARYVRAALTEDAVEASDIYKGIVAENPDKPIAREALLQLYKFHFAAGDYRAARAEYLQLRKYPDLAKLTDPTDLEDSLQTPKALARPQALTPPTLPQPGESGSFVVQVGVFSTPENAHKFVESLRTNRINGTVFTKIEPDRTLYAVSAGSFSTREAAQSFAADLKSRSINCIVVQR